MANTNTKQLRGHCQCCGREQAVKNGRMAHHGYEVKNHWFVGVCNGHLFAPIEVERTMADSVVATCRELAGRMEDKAMRYERGQDHPSRIRKATWRPDEDKYMDWELGTLYQQRDALHTATWEARQYAKANRDFADNLEKLVTRYHGKPLREAERPVAAAPILCGEKRKLADGRILTCTRVQGSKVFYSQLVNGREHLSRTTSRYWRGYQLVEG